MYKEEKRRHGEERSDDAIQEKDGHASLAMTMDFDPDILWTNCSFLRPLHRDRYGEECALRNHPEMATLPAGARHDVTLNRHGEELCSEAIQRYQLICDEEWIPFAPNSFDAVVCFFNLHWVNDLVGCLKQILYILKPDGLLMGCLFGGDTLKELKACFYEAELSLIHRTYPRFSPVLTPQDIGYLLQRTGFALPVVDRDLFKLRYQNLPELLKDLKKIQLRNNLVDIVPLKRSVLKEVDSLYQKHYLVDNTLQATFDILYLNAWAPSPIQQKPLLPGSAKKLLTEVL